MEEAFLIAVEGAKMTVCGECAQKHGRLIAKIAAPEPERKYVAPAVEVLEPEIEVIDDYPAIIRKARMAKGWEQDELAKKVNEGLSTIRNIEASKLTPTEQVAKKIGRVLGIKLLQQLKPKALETKKEASRPMTIGDILKNK